MKHLEVTGFIIIAVSCLKISNGQSRGKDLTDFVEDFKTYNRRPGADQRFRRPNMNPNDNQLDPNRGFGKTGSFHSKSDSLTNPQPLYVVVASQVVRPGAVFRVAASILAAEKPLSVRVSIQRDGTEIGSAASLIDSGETQMLLIQIPSTSISGHYRLRVEGNDVGSVGGTRFLNETTLHFSSQFLSILIQTNRPIYNGGQIVRFRGVLLTTSLRPFDDPLDVFILDPSGLIMRRWPSRQTNQGVLSLNFKLPEYAKIGDWKIRINAQGQVEEKNFTVEKYFQPRFEVEVKMKTFFLETEETISGKILANYTNFRAVPGNCTLKFFVRNYVMYPNSRFQELFSEFIEYFPGTYTFDVPMRRLLSLVPRLDGSEIRVEAEVGEHFLQLKQSGFSTSRIVNSTLSLKFLGKSPFVFKPGMLFECYVSVSYHDLQPLHSRKLNGSVLRLTPSVNGARGSLLPQDIVLSETGVGHVKWLIPEGSTKLSIKAYYSDREGDRAEADLVAYPYFSSNNEYIQVFAQTKSAHVGEFSIFHVRTNFYVERLHYLVIAKGLVIYSGEKEIQDINIPSITPIDLPISSDMAPTFSVVVYVVTHGGIVMADSIIMPVDAFTSHKVKFTVNPAKDQRMDTVEFRVEGEVGSYFCMSGLREETYNMQSGHELSAASVLESLNSFENTSRPIFQSLLRYREGQPDVTSYYPTPNFGIDSNRTFSLAGLIVFTDGVVNSVPETDRCGESLPCLTTGCYRPEQKCDGRNDCPDMSDEAECPVSHDDLKQFKLTRQNRLHRFYDEIEGDWAWQEVSSYGYEIFNVPVPKRPSRWVLNMFALGKESGLGIIQVPVYYDNTRPFLLTIEVAEKCRQHEQVSIRACLFNFQSTEIEAMVQLPDSPQYRFVHVEEYGAVNSYNPRTSRGEHQHLLWIRPHTSVEVYFPIVPTQSGPVGVTLFAFTQLGRDNETKIIDVGVEGVSFSRHTSLLLDLKNRATIYQFLDVVVEESPEVLYQKWRRYIYGTPRGRVSVFGDIVGPAFPTIPATAMSLLNREGLGADISIFEFSANLWTLHYQRLTNQLDWKVAKKVFIGLNEMYSAIMNYRNEDGSFSMWINSEPSVWLTANVLLALSESQFQDWENFIYIDPEVMATGISWLLKYQTPTGAFREPDFFEQPLDPEMRSSRDAFLGTSKNISLTAHVLITLQSVQNSLPGTLQTQATNSKILATKYLQYQLSSMKDPYDIAIVAYALTLVNSGDKETAFNMLDSSKREQDGRVYWSRDRVESNPIKYETHSRPFIMAKNDEEWDAHAITTTSYALMVYLAREGINVIQEQIVEWLSSMRKCDGGFDSTFDSVVALRALTEYSYRARLRDITDMSVTFEFSSQVNDSKEVFLDSKNLGRLQQFYMRNVWGHVNVIARGAGQAVVQLDVSYGVDYPHLIYQPPTASFDLKITSRFTGFNSSVIHVTSCQRWVNVKYAKTSGAAVLEIAVPSGYKILQPELDHFTNLHVNRSQLRWAHAGDTVTSFYFNHLNNSVQCLNYTLQRWNPVANMSRFLTAKIYEMYSPEHFNMTMFETFDLSLLNICEVCGSYQCPYCPIFSSATDIRTNYVLYFAAVLTAFYTSLYR